MSNLLYTLHCGTCLAAALWCMLLAAPPHVWRVGPGEGVAVHGVCIYSAVSNRVLLV